jgi:hypothetical protein
MGFWPLPDRRHVNGLRPQSIRRPIWTRGSRLVHRSHCLDRLRDNATAVAELGRSLPDRRGLSRTGRVGRSRAGASQPKPGRAGPGSHRLRWGGTARVRISAGARPWRSPMASGDRRSHACRGGPCRTGSDRALVRGSGFVTTTALGCWIAAPPTGCPGGTVIW